MNAALETCDVQLGTADNAFVRFGPGGRLLGILSGPPGRGPMLLLPSAGLQPRSGPFRLHATLAERLAERGIRSFRFDVPGVGEAPSITGCDATQASIAAIDRLQSSHGCEHFVIGGICSAADTGWDVAVTDTRVSGLLLMDGVCFSGPWYHYARAIGLIRRLPWEWKHFARRLPQRLRARGGLDANAFRSWPDRELAMQQFAEMIDRRVRVLSIFSGGYAEHFLHPRQFEWSFGPAVRDPGVTMHYWPDCDHTYFGRAQRERLIGTVSEWMDSLRTKGEQ